MKTLIAVAILFAAASALADDESFCPERPGQTTPPCVLGTGKVAIETAAAAWTLSRDSDSRTDTVIIGDSLLRIGVAPSLEGQVGWTPAGYARVHDRTGNTVATTTQPGDIKLGLLYGPFGPN